MPKLIAGNQLNESQKRHVLAAYVYRWTTDNRQRTQAYSCKLCDIRTPYENKESSNGHTHPTIPLISDEQWLSAHAFYVKANGEIADRPGRCEPVYLAE